MYRKKNYFMLMFGLMLQVASGCSTKFENLGVVTLRDGSEVQAVRFMQERFNGNDMTIVYPFHFDHKIRRAVMLEPTSVAGPGLGKSFLPAASVAIGYAAGQALRRPDEVDIRQSNSQNGGGATAYGGDSDAVAHGGNPVANGGQATAHGGVSSSSSNSQGGDSKAYGGEGGKSVSNSSSNAETHPKVSVQNSQYQGSSSHSKSRKRLLSDYYPNHH